MKTKELGQKNNFDVAIVGGGMAGLVLSCLLGDSGFSVCVVDAEDPQHFATPSGRTVALMGGSIDIIKATGIWPDIIDKICPLDTLRIIDDSAGHVSPLQIDFKPQDIGRSSFGYNIPHHVLKPALIQRIQTLENIFYLPKTRVSDIAVSPARVTLTTDHGVYTARLVIGTDGKKSIVRQTAHIELDKKSYGQTAMTCLIRHTRPHHNISTEHHRPGGPFTYVPLPGNVSSIVWVEKDKDISAYLSLKKQDLERAIQDRSLDALGRVTLMTDPQSWPLVTLTAQKLVAPRMALAGEAAHAFSPIGAQGLNLSLRDVAVLAEILTDSARLGEDIGDLFVLSRYQSRRQTDIQTRTWGVNNLNRMVSNDTEFLRGLRRTGLKTLARFPALRQVMMKEGLSPLTGHIRLMQESAL